MSILILVGCLCSTVGILSLETGGIVSEVFTCVSLLLTMAFVYKVWLDERRKENDRRVSWRYESMND